MYLKRIFIFLFVSAIAVFCFAGCCAGNLNNNVKESNSKIETQTYDEDEINKTNALSLIKSYMPEELGLTGSVNDYTFLVSSEKIVMENEEYYKVVAGIVNESGKNDIYNIEEINHYLVSDNYDKVLLYDKEADNYDSIANVHKIPNIDQ